MVFITCIPAVIWSVSFTKKPTLFLQALCFEAYFQEAVPQAQNETYRIRKCRIYFYMEDDTIQVVEPEYKNSGIPQGEKGWLLLYYWEPIVTVAQMKMFLFFCSCMISNCSFVGKIPFLHSILQPTE